MRQNETFLSNNRHFETKSLTEEFCRHFGSTPLVISEMWNDLCDLKLLNKKEKSEKGFVMFVMAMYFLWVHPRNASILASPFGLCKDYCQGKYLWRWVRRIESLSAKKIKWNKRFDSKDSEMFVISCDGIDFRT